MSERKEGRMELLCIGGGAAGYFAAIRAAEVNPAASVRILERGKEVLEKVRISGGGRCNVTHACWEPRDLVTYYPRGGRELLGPFTRFACGDTVDWFERRGVRLKIEEDGRMFPVSDRSQTIIDCLESAARQAGVQVMRRQRVEQIQPPDAGRAHWLVGAKTDQFSAARLLIAAGSNPAMWDLLAGLGHRIVPPVPSLFTFTIRDSRIADLPGLAVPTAAIRIEDSKLEARGPLLLTHWGMSGPAVLKLSAWGARELHERQYRFAIRINWPGDRPGEVREKLLALKSEQAARQASSNPAFGIPARLWRNLTLAAGIASQQRWGDLSKQQLAALEEELCQGRFEVVGKSTFKEEFVTAGGVDLREVDFKRFESRIHPGLFFAGEVLDIDALTGGFNFQAAWTGGWIAGQAMAT